MIETVEQLKRERPDLVKAFDKMTRDQLLEQCYLECIDAINMEERMQFMMNECTGMSKTNYTIESLKTLVRKRQEEDENMLYETILEDIEGMDAQEIREYLRR